MTDDDLDIEESAYLKNESEYYDTVRGIVKNLIDVQKTHGMGTEYLFTIFQTLGITSDAKALREASWHALCEWDL